MVDQGVSQDSVVGPEGKLHSAFARVFERGHCLQGCARRSRVAANLNDRVDHEGSIGPVVPLKVIMKNPPLPVRTSQGTPLHGFACMASEMSDGFSSEAVVAKSVTEQT
mmetsp:Transcript_52501/g.139793  ORF Transcript_52501/g.139793 Transcript_52501/m.139793 type:complete len:109 (-) Transcript_52501:139-465(-)